MAIQWSDEQLQAIDSRGENLLVSAAAGSGKTAVLTERILRLIADKEHPVEVDRMLVVTFTRAAAAQMRGKIEKELDERIAANPDDGWLRHQKLMLGAARISTIHSLCQELIQSHFEELDLDPSYRLGDDNEIKILQSETVREVMEEYYLSQNAAFLEFVRAYAPGRSDSAITSWILEGYNMSRSCPDPDYWLDSCVKWYEVPKAGMKEHALVKYAVAHARQVLQKQFFILERQLEVCIQPDGPGQYADALLDAKEKIGGLMQAKSLVSLKKGLEKLCAKSGSGTFKALPRKKMPSTNENKKKSVQAAYKKVREDTRTLCENMFRLSLSDLKYELSCLEPSVRMLAELIRTFSERFAQEKRERNLLDYGDLEHYALKLLARFYVDDSGALCWKPTQTADELSAWYSEVICDEYQDSNQVQEIILEALSGSRHGNYDRFMVGDVKQSIYRFRLADAGIFIDKYREYSHADHCRRIDLQQNYRSRRHILDAANFIFRRLMRPEGGGVDYDEKAMLRPGASFPKAGAFTVIPDKTDIVLVEKAPAGAAAEMDADELEAEAIADKIKELTDSVSGIDIPEGDSYRKAGFGDIVILMRSVQGHADTMVNVLNNRGIPAAAELSVGFFTAPEIMTMLSLLQIIDNPRQDIPLAAVLRSPIVGMTADELAWVRANCPEGSFFDALSAMSEESPGYEKAEAFRGMLGKLRHAGDYMQVDELIDYAYGLTGYYDYAGAMPAGSRRKANLDTLREKAVAFTATGMSGLFDFMHYIEQTKKNEIDFGEAQDQDHTGGHVTVLTVHKSKGLEFPVVILAGMGRRINRKDSQSAAVFHAKYGIGLNAANPRTRRKFASGFRKFVAEQTKAENMAEEIRILYVAATRAKQKLVFTGVVDDAIKAGERWRQEGMDDGERMSPWQIEGARTYFDLVMPCILDERAADEAKRLFQKTTVSCGTLAENAARGYAALQKEKDNAQAAAESSEKSRDAALMAALDKDASWEYSWKDELHLRGKYSVSELKAGEPEDEESEYTASYDHDMPEHKPRSAARTAKTETSPPEEEERTPLFLQEKRKPQERILTGADYGTAFHRVMALLDFENVPDGKLRPWVERQICAMTESGRLEEFQARLVNPAKICAFLGTGLAGRMMQAARRGELWREQQFVMSVPANLADPAVSSTQPVIVQGAIDAFFTDGERTVLLDYKTDALPAEDGEKRLVEKYIRQLEYYRYAIEHSRNRKVTEIYLYSSYLEEVIPCGDNEEKA